MVIFLHNVYIFAWIQHDLANMVFALDPSNTADVLKLWTLKFPTKWYVQNSANPNQTASEGAVRSGSTLFAISLSILRNNFVKSKI